MGLFKNLWSVYNVLSTAYDTKGIQWEEYWRPLTIFTLREQESLVRNPGRFSQRVLSYHYLQEVQIKTQRALAQGLGFHFPFIIFQKSLNFAGSYFLPLLDKRFYYWSSMGKTSLACRLQVLWQRYKQAEAGVKRERPSLPGWQVPASADFGAWLSTMSANSSDK
jgi:hypothetical protein